MYIYYRREYGTLETCTCIGIERKEKKEGRGRGQESRLSPPRSGPLPHHTDDAQRPATPQRNTAAHTTAPRARAQGPKCRIHTASTKGGASAMAGRLTDKTYRQTETATKRETQRREGLGKRGGTSKTKEQSSGHGGAHSVVGPDGRITSWS